MAETDRRMVTCWVLLFRQLAFVLGCMGLFGVAATAQIPGGEARLAKESVSYEALPENKTLKVGLRFIHDGMLVGASARSGGVQIPASGQAFTSETSPACAWLVVVDTSNPARRSTIGRGAGHAGELIRGLPAKDAVAIYGLDRDLKEFLPFGAPRGDLDTVLGQIVPEGDASLTTLIYTNLQAAVLRLKERGEPRKALVVLTDGKDESPTPEAGETAKSTLIQMAKEAGVVIHTIGYAERSADQSYFASLKQMSEATEGIHVAAALAIDKALPPGSLDGMRDAMAGAGEVVLDLSSLSEASPVTLIVRAGSGREATFQIPADEVAKAMERPEAETNDQEIQDPLPEDESVEPETQHESESATSGELAPDPVLQPESDTETRPQWLLPLAAGLIVLLVLVAARMRRAARRRKAEEVARAEEERRAQEAVRAEEEAGRVATPPLAWLEMCDEQQTRHEIRSPSLKIGRGRHNDLVLRNDSVSGNHCVLNQSREGGWNITDLNSGNGVLVNGEKILQAALHHEDVIELGDLKMRFLEKT